MIKLSRLADYGVVVLTNLAREQGVLKTASGLSEQTNLPEPTVAKVLKLLAKGGLVKSVRGVNGGYVMERSADEISVSEVITALDGPVALTACIEGNEDDCRISETCNLHGCWDGVNSAISSALEQMKLTELIRSRQ